MKRAGSDSKIPTPITPVSIEKRAAILRWLILTRKAPWITLAPFRAYPSVLTPKECAVSTFPLQERPCPSGGVYERIWGAGRRGLYHPLFYVKRWGCIIFPSPNLTRSGPGCKRAEGKSFTYEELDKSWKIRSFRDILCPLSGAASERPGAEGRLKWRFN